ncbi:hypothetical protein M2266_005108 [Streptomyces sp. SPB162]|nr:hypothetical protein [Streptomyces sp. SPB162]
MVCGDENVVAFLQQLGQQVHEVGHGGAVDVRLGYADQLDALVRLHLGGRCTQHVDERDRLVPAAARLLAGEDQQVLAVAPHTGGEVVHLEQVLELVRVRLVVLQLGDQCELALDEALVPTREVGEDRVDVAPQQCLLGGEPDGLAVHLVEGAGDLADLVVAGDRDRDDGGVHPARVGARQLVDQPRKPLFRDVEGGVAQLAHAAAHVAGHHARDDEGQDQGEDHDGRVDDRVGLGAGGDGLRVVHGGLGEVLLDGPVRVEGQGVAGEPALRRDALGAELPGRLVRGDLDDHLLDRRRLHERLTGLLGLGGGGRELLLALLVRGGLGVLQVLGVGGGAAAGVLLERDALEVEVRGEGGLLELLLLGRHLPLDQDVHTDGAGERLGGLGQRNGVQGTAVAGDVPGAQAQLVGELHQRVLHADVRLFGLPVGQLPGVGGLADGLQAGLRPAEALHAALQRGGGRHLVDGLVEGLGGGVGGGVGPRHDGIAALALDEGNDRDVTFVDQGVAVTGGGTHQVRGPLRRVRLLPGVHRVLHGETAHDEGDDDRDEEDGVQPRGHPPVPHRETAAGPGGLRGGDSGRVGHALVPLGRREIAPGAFRGARLCSPRVPHLTNNLSATTQQSAVTTLGFCEFQHVMGVLAKRRTK